MHREGRQRTSVMATMATMATPKLKLEKNEARRWRGMITNKLIPKRFFFRGWSAGVAMVAMVATDQKSPRVSC